ncbi:MAG: porin family protein [Ferruginibacter sp.]
MKKSILLLIGYFLLLNYSKAQQSAFGITAGAALTSYKIKAESVSVTSKTKPGFTVGIISSLGLGQHFSFMPSLNYIQKGGSIEGQGSTDKITLNYLELPLNFVYNSNSANGRFFIGAGPSLGMGLSGKDKSDGNGTGPMTADIKFGSGESDDFKAFEAGVNFLAGYQFKGGFLLTANYNAGLNNIANTSAGDPIKTKYHNRYFGIRIGFMFPGKKK